MSLPAHVASMPSLIDPAALRAGDLVLVRFLTPGPIQKAIERQQKKFMPATDSQWTHAAVMCSDYRILEMTTDGIQTEYLWTYQDGQHDVRIRRIVGLSATGGAEVVQNAYENSLTTQSYDFMTIFALLKFRAPKEMRNVSPNAIKRSICSAVYARAASFVGKDLALGLDHRLVTPAHLSGSSLMTDVAPTTITGAAFTNWWLNGRPAQWFTP